MQSDSIHLSRRDALVKLLRVAGAGAGAAGLGLWLSKHNCCPKAALDIAPKSGHTIATDPKLPEMAVITGDDPAQLTCQVVEELGGIRRFIARGDIVLVKPNI